MGSERTAQRKHLLLHAPPYMIKILSRLIQKKPEVIPATEPLNSVDYHELNRGNCYLVKEPKPKLSFEVFAATIKGKCPDCDHPEAFPCESIGCEECTLACPCKACRHTRAQGLCITMRSPETIRDEYFLQTTPIFWISKHGADSICPTCLEMAANMIYGFLKRSKNPVVLLDGLEYLIVANGFASTLKFLRDVQEWVVLQEAIFVLPISPVAIEKRALALIERDMLELDVQKP
ncbi:MAG: DUF835 domain-containing protein [Methanothrix sp.]|nr:MAG: DUF835 domain-containing protein [Methanothrix sp.]